MPESCNRINQTSKSIQLDNVFHCRQQKNEGNEEEHSEYTATLAEFFESVISCCEPYSKRDA